MGDVEDYLEFLKEPPGAWIASKADFKKGGSLWRPFCEKGLAGNSFLTATRSIKSLFSFLHNASYINANPLSLIKNITQKTMDVEISKIDVKKRMLNDDEWRVFLKALDGLDESTGERRDIKHRSKLLVAMLYYLGLRIFELEKSLWSSFYYEESAWWFFVKGKGGKLAKVPVNESLLNLINIYRKEMGKGALPKDMSDDAPILTFKNKPLSKYSMYKYIKEIAVTASNSFKEGSLSNEKLKKMSPHWLRHLSASHQDKLGVPATIIKENHRHGSFLTTQIYLHGEDNVRHSEIQKLNSKINIDGAARKKKRFKVLIQNAWCKEDRVVKFFYQEQSFGSSDHIQYAKKLYRLKSCPSVIQYHHKGSININGKSIEYLISDYTEGEVLSSYLSQKTNKRISQFESLHIFYAIIKGVEHIHAQGEYHGDLHSDNIIISRSGLGYKAWIIDILHLGRSTKAKIQSDVFDLVNILYEMVGGSKNYAKCHSNVKNIILGRKKTLIKDRFKSAEHLRYYLDNLTWD